MPLGPRPEPPPVPKKEPRYSTMAGDYVRSPVPPSLPPKTPAVGGSTEFTPHPSAATSPIAYMSPSSKSRLKGPRPLGPGAPRLPYPAEMGYEPPLAMPEPDPINSAVPGHGFYASSPTSWRSFDPYSLAASNTTLASVDSVPFSKPSVPNLVPQPEYETRPTRSIFQWGIPEELLPPMPVPLNSISGLTLGDAGQLTMNINLPEHAEQRRPRFSVEQITVADLEQARDVWSLSSLSRWLYELVVSFDAEFSVNDVQQLFTRLFMFRTKGLKWDRAERLAQGAVQSLQQQKFITGSSDSLCLSALGPCISGVLTELTGCYRQQYGDSYYCYSSTSFCRPLQRSTQRAASVAGGTTLFSSEWGRAASTTTAGVATAAATTVAPVSEAASAIPLALDLTTILDPTTTLEMNWRKFWCLDEKDVEEVDGKMVKLQFAIHELIMSEVSFVRDLITYLDVYGEIELMKGLSVMSKQDEFCSRVFDRIRAILKVNQQLLGRMLERQATQGPYVYDIADLITEWAQSPKTMQAYGDYAEDYLWSEHHLRTELAQSTRLQHWMDERAKDPRITGRPHSFFFHRVLPRLARYQLLLNAVLKYTPDEMVAQRRTVEQAIAAATELTLQSDARVDKQQRILDVQNLKAHIVFKSTAVTADLKLGDKRRKLIRRGDMVRKGDMKMDWVDTHTLLLDNFLVLSKTREGVNGTAFYVTKAPIPLDLLVLESASEEGVVKVSSKLTLTRHGPADVDSVPQDGERPVLYPIRITHLGSGGQKYVLFIPSKPERTQWAQAIVDAKQSRAQLAHARSAEPFRFVQITDGFRYPEREDISLPVPIPDTPIARAVTTTDPSAASRVILSRRVNCMQPLGTGYILGTDFGLWIGHEGQWMRALDTPQKIIKVEVLETMNIVFILCGDHNLSWYPLDEIVARALGDKRRAVGVRLNRQRKVVDFAATFHCGRVLVMYLQQGGILKVVEPVKSHGAVAMKIVEKVGLDQPSSCIETFREVDKVQTSSDTFRVMPLMKSIVLLTSRYFEYNTLDPRQSVRLPVGGKPTKEMQFYGRPVKLIKLDATHFLKCFEACYVICDYEGQDCIQPTTWFLDRVADCAFYAPYLILFAQSGELVEVRYVEEFPGRLVQLITGKDIKLLSSDDETVYFRMAHQWLPGRQLILQMIGNEVVRDAGSTWHSSSV